MASDFFLRFGEDIHSLARNSPLGSIHLSSEKVEKPKASSLSPLDIVSKASTAIKVASNKAKQALTDLRDDIAATDIKFPVFDWASHATFTDKEALRSRIAALSQNPQDFLLSLTDASVYAELIDIEGAAASTSDILEADDDLRKLHAEFVPRLVSDEEFWRRYFQAIARIRWGLDQEQQAAESERNLSTSSSPGATPTGLFNFSPFGPLREERELDNMEGFSGSLAVLSLPSGALVREMAHCVRESSSSPSILALASSNPKWPPAALAHAVGSGIGRALHLGASSSSSSSSATPPSCPQVEEALARLFQVPAPAAGADPSGAFSCRCSSAASASIPEDAGSGGSAGLTGESAAAQPPSIPTAPLSGHPSPPASACPSASAPLPPSRSLVFAVHGAPPDSFVARLAEAGGSLPSSREAAQLWLAVLAEVERRFRAGEPLPLLQASWEGPDLRLGELSQHLQMLNCCVARRRRRQAVARAWREAGGRLEAEGAAGLRKCEACGAVRRAKRGAAASQARTAEAQAEAESAEQRFVPPELCPTCGVEASASRDGLKRSAHHPHEHEHRGTGGLDTGGEGPPSVPSAHPAAPLRLAFPRITLPLAIRSPFSAHHALPPNDHSAAAAPEAPAPPHASALSSLALNMADPQAALRLASAAPDRSPAGCVAAAELSAGAAAAAPVPCVHCWSGEEEEDEESEEAELVPGPQRRRGALHPLPALRLLLTGEPLHVPATQDGPLMTEAALRECEELIMRTGSVGTGCKQLFSDMQAFKAANPGCVLEDFVRWYSPPDWSPVPLSAASGPASLRHSCPAFSSGAASSLPPACPPSSPPLCAACRHVAVVSPAMLPPSELASFVCSCPTSRVGYLSVRMTAADNLWRQLWQRASPLPAWRQPPIFDEELAGESSLEWLRNVSPAALFQELFCVLVGVGFSRALSLVPSAPPSSTSPCEGEGSAQPACCEAAQRRRERLLECSRYVAGSCTRSMGESKMDCVCLVYEMMETIARQSLAPCACSLAESAACNLRRSTSLPLGESAPLAASASAAAPTAHAPLFSFPSLRSDERHRAAGAPDAEATAAGSEARREMRAAEAMSSGEGLAGAREQAVGKQLPIVNAAAAAANVAMQLVLGTELFGSKGSRDEENRQVPGTYNRSTLRKTVLRESSNIKALATDGSLPIRSSTGNQPDPPFHDQKPGEGALGRLRHSDGDVEWVMV